MAARMKTISDPSEVRAWCADRRAEGHRIGFVPTMGYLHEGHLSLLRIAAERADRLVLSIFVNPTQFGPSEDLDRYPRDPSGDGRKCEAAGVDLIFQPTVEQMYGPDDQTFVEVGSVGEGLCGERRPGHFRGVCTVVNKLLNIVGPCVAVFGEKDYQQLLVIRRMVSDLKLPAEVVGGPIVREPDGIAMSSRNAYLTDDQRRAATSLSRSLRGVREQVAAGERSVAALVERARATIEAEPEVARIDYVELRDRSTLGPVEEARAGETIMLLAVFVGKTRLIDNLLL